MSFETLSPSRIDNNGDLITAAPPEKSPKKETKIFIGATSSNEATLQQWRESSNRNGGFPRPDFGLRVNQNNTGDPGVQVNSITKRILFDGEENPAKEKMQKREVSPPRRALVNFEPLTPHKPGRKRSTTREIVKKSLFSLPHNLRINGVKVKLTPLSAGCHMSVFTLEAATQICENVKNEAVVLKAYNPRVLTRPTKEIESKLSSSLYHYNIARELNLSVANILNFPTAGSDRYLLQERIPYEIDINNPEHIRQVKKFFIGSLSSGTAMDLIPANLLVRESGEVVLIDFVEDATDGYAVFINKAVLEWGVLFANNNYMNRVRTEKFLENLTEDFAEYSFQCRIEPIVEEIFFQVSKKPNFFS